MRSIDLAQPIMKRTKLPQAKIQELTREPQPTAAVALSQNEIDVVPSLDEMARSAYLSYFNQGSLPGHDVRHWLEAETHLLAERNLTRVNSFPNCT